MHVTTGSPLNTPDQIPSMPDPLPHTWGALPPDVMIRVLVCPPYQARELREKWNGLLFSAVSPRPSLIMSIC